jgi:hypothetical protein
MAKYRINMALWQVPTLVVNTGVAQEDQYQRRLANTIAAVPLDQRVELLRKRIGKADAFFSTTPGPLKRYPVTVFAAPEYLFARSASEHFITETEKDGIVDGLRSISRDFPHIVLFPGTIAWAKETQPGTPETKHALAQRKLAGTTVYSTNDLEALKKAQKKKKNRFSLARNTCYVMHGGDLLLEYHKRDNGNEVHPGSDGTDVYFVHGATDSVFDAEGLTFGLKVCAEVRTDLPCMVDVQVVISASHRVTGTSMQLKPGGYCGHADAVLPPTVRRYEEGKYVEVSADKSRRGGGPITKNQAGRRITHALSYKTNPKLLPDSQAYAEKITEMRGRARYYRLDYSK